MPPDQRSWSVHATVARRVIALRPASAGRLAAGWHRKLSRIGRRARSERGNATAITAAIATESIAAAALALAAAAALALAAAAAATLAAAALLTPAPLA